MSQVSAGLLLARPELAMKSRSPSLLMLAIVPLSPCILWLANITAGSRPMTGPAVPHVQQTPRKVNPIRRPMSQKSDSPVKTLPLKIRLATLSQFAFPRPKQKRDGA